MKRSLALLLCLTLQANSETFAIFRPYVARRVPAPVFENSARIRDLLRGGNLYLSLSDAVALAVENNLDVDLVRYAVPIGDSEILRAQGGGVTRGIYYTIAQPPTGVGGPLSPLLTQAATQSTPGTSVASNALELGVLAEPQVNLSTQTTIPLSAGSPVPSFDPSLFANYAFTHQSVISALGYPALVSPTQIQTGNAGYQEGFSTGTNVVLAFSNTAETVNAPDYVINPFIASDLSLTVTQPLLRGFRRRINQRYIRIAATEKQISSLLFRQQLIEVVYGIVRLYTDLVALYEDVKVKEETLAFAQKLLEDTKSEVDEGVIAPLELSRARAQVSGSRQDLINSRGLLEEQEAIVKNVITRRGIEDADVRSARIIPTETLAAPPETEPPALAQLLDAAYKSRPDLGQAVLQTKLTEIGLEGSKDNLRPELDLVGSAQNNAIAGQTLPLNSNSAFNGGYGTVLDQIATRKNPTYSIGLNLTLPLRNRVAQADEIHDQIQLRQVQIRERQLRNQVQLEVEDAVIAMRRAQASYEAAKETRALQEQSLALEQTRFTEGVSTAFFVIQYESYVAQARSSEVVAKSAYLKAKAALERAVGSILEDHGVTLEPSANRVEVHEPAKNH